MSSAPQPALLWRFNGSNVDSVTGLSPSSSTGTLGYTQGLYNQSAFFNQTPGTTPTLSLTYNLPSAITANNCTISCWINPYFSIPSSSGNQQFIAFVDSQVTYYFGFNSTSSTTQPYLYYYNGSSNTILGGSPATRVWFHQVAVLSNVGQTGQNSSWTYYYNGVYIGNQVITKSGSSPITSLYVGQAQTAINSSYMAIQDLRIYTTALSASQIYGIYQSQGIPPSLTMTPASGSLPDPAYAWQFNGTAVDAVRGIAPTQAYISGTLVTSPATLASSLIYDSTTAKYGSAISLSNPSGATSTTNTIYYKNTLNIPFGGGASSTVSFWFKLLNSYTSGADNTILFLSIGGGSRNYYIINYISPTPRIGSYGNWTGASDFGPGFDISPVVGTWYHLTLLITSTSSRMYLNGSAGTTTTYTSPTSGVWDSLALATYDFGGYPSGATSSVEIDDLRIYTTALSAAQIQTIYQSGGNLYGANTVQPSLLFSLNGTTTDSITGLTGTTTGTVSYNSSGKYGQSLIMDGSSYVKYSKTLGYNLGTGGATFAMWFKLLAVPVGGLWMFGASGTSYNDRIYILVSTSGFIGWTFIDNNLAAKDLYSPSALVVGTWTHLTFTLFNGTMTMYINGSQVATRSDVPMSGVILDTQFSLAALAGGSVNNINAEYDDFRIYNTALSAQQIQGIYQSQGIPPTLTLTPASGALPGPAYAWQFQGNTNDTITGLAFTPTGTFAYVSGQYGQGINIQNPTYVASNLMSLTISSPVSSANFSICTWVNFVALNSLGIGIVLNLFKAGRNNGIRFGLPSSSSGPSPQFSWYDDSNTNRTTTGSGSLNTWTHMAASFLNGTMTTYLNGYVVDTAAGTAGINTYNTVILGNYVYNGYPIQNASIDDLRIYNQALTSAQIQTIYQSGGNFGANTNTVQPSLFFSLNGTTNDSILGIQGTVVGTTQYVTGRYGQAFNFLNTQGSAASNYITATQSAVTFSNTAGFSMSWWIYRSVAVTSTQREIGIYNGSTLILATSTTSTGIQMFPPSTGSTYPNVRTPVPVNQWVHLAFSLNATTSALYLNGVLTPTSGSFIPGSGFNGFNGQILLGADTTTSTGPHQGYMQDFRMYTTALSAQQIQGIYLSGGAPPQARLTSG